MSDPLPIALGDNTIYALRLAEGGVLLIDAGPDIPSEGAAGDGTWGEALIQARAHGFAPGDVRAVVVTHFHMDHGGLAARWAEAGATILAGAADAPALAAGNAWNEARIPARIAALREHGCPPDLAERFAAPNRRRPPHYRWDPCPRESLRSLAGDLTLEIEGGARLRVLAAPGHTPGNLVAYLDSPTADGHDLFSGDTLLPHTVPTPGIHFPAPRSDAPPGLRWPSLPPFIASVARLRRFEVRRILPGHGAPVDDPDRLFDRFERHHDRRRARVRALLAESPDTAYGVVGRLFPHLPEARLAQAMTEVIGQLDVLWDRGEAVAERSDGESGGVVRYRLAADTRSERG